MDGVDDFFARGRLMSISLVVALLVWAGLKTMLGSAPPPIPVSLANGTYVSSCCGNIVLHDGVMTYDDHTATYTLVVGKTDLSANVNGNPIVTTGHKVAILPGIQKSGFSFWRYPHRSNMMNLYDASREPPDRLSLWGQDYSGPYDFVRVSK